MTPEDAIYRYRLRTLALAREIGSVRGACRVIGIHHSAFYRWKSRADSYGPGLLRPRERRRAQMPNSISPLFEQRIRAFASGNPGLGPVRPAAEPQRAEWGGLRVSAGGVRRVLKRHGRSARARRPGAGGRLCRPTGTAASRTGTRAPPVDRPGALVQFDCFQISLLSGTGGTLWRHSAIDVASSYLWAELHLTPRNPSARWTSRPARRVARDPSARGWQLEAVMTDDGS